MIPLRLKGPGPLYAGSDLCHFLSEVDYLVLGVTKILNITKVLLGSLDARIKELALVLVVLLWSTSLYDVCVELVAVPVALSVEHAVGYIFQVLFELLLIS